MVAAAGSPMWIEPEPHKLMVIGILTSGEQPLMQSGWLPLLCQLWLAGACWLGHTAASTGPFHRGR